MGNAFDQILDEAVLLENNTARLYLIFAVAFPGDAEFWGQLACEEKNHAALICTVKDFFLAKGLVPNSLFSASYQELMQANEKVAALIGQFEKAPPSRREAFIAALAVEESAGEIHFQNYMSGKAEERIDEVFKELNRADKDHAERIRSYMAAHGAAASSVNKV